ncbi:MAG: GTP 3',8-cyclase MoaA [Gemmatimonadota bacterium]|nr:MAG: GTP 3',8-cyclase MoaA [Gemmatimonadota bacterium]
MCRFVAADLHRRDRIVRLGDPRKVRRREGLRALSLGGVENLADTALAESGAQVADRLGRPLRSLRLSLIDMCNLRCNYCMPADEYIWLPREDILTVDEICRLVGLFTECGVDKVRLTGGEPLMRRELVQIVERLAANPRISDLSLTTNAVQLGRRAESLKAAGLGRVTVSLDTLRRDRFRQLTRRDQLDQVIEGIEAARRAGFEGLKINTVIMRGYNDDELIDLLEFGKRTRSEVRFIEYMDVGGATQWSMDRVVSRGEMLEKLEARYGAIERLSANGSAPADRYVLGDGTVFGVIASTTEPFCRTCDRSRVTADGLWFLCLYASSGIDLRTPLREAAPPEEIVSLIADAWAGRVDRGAEERRGLSQRGPLYQIEDLRKDPHREMHTRGG